MVEEARKCGCIVQPWRSQLSSGVHKIFSTRKAFAALKDSESARKIYVYIYMCIFVFLYFCIYVYMYICIHVYMCRCIYVYMSICLDVYIYRYIYIYVYVYVYVCMYMCICVYMYICIYVYICILHVLYMSCICLICVVCGLRVIALRPCSLQISSLSGHSFTVDIRSIPGRLRCRGTLNAHSGSQSWSFLNSTSTDFQHPHPCPEASVSLCSRPANRDRDQRSKN